MYFFVSNDCMPNCKASSAIDKIAENENAPSGPPEEDDDEEDVDDDDDDGVDFFAFAAEAAR